jgi:hypothetical protein
VVIVKVFEMIAPGNGALVLALIVGAIAGDLCLDWHKKGN